MSESKKDRQKAGLAGAASAVLASKAPKNLLGYEKVYHGTGKEAATSIQATGLKKSKSGTGIAANDIAYGRATAKEVKGKVYTTKDKLTANLHHPDFFGRRSGRTLKMRTPYRRERRLAQDVVLNRVARGADAHTANNKLQQFNARAGIKNLRIYKHSIPTRFIEGSHDYGGRRQFATKGNMRRYLSSATGKARFAKGVAQAAGAAGAGMYAVAKGLKAKKDAKNSK